MPIECLIARMSAYISDHDFVAIGLRLGCSRRAYHAPFPTDVFNNHRLAELFGERGRH
jgi:hypothetical protein